MSKDSQPQAPEQPGNPHPGVRDQVDAILADWAQAVPDMDASPMAVLSRVSRLSHHLEKARRTAFAAHGLETFEFDVLSELRRAGDTLTPSQLVARTLVTSGTMTNRITRMVDRGLITREPDPHDGRGARIAITAQGRHKVDHALKELVDSERHILAGLSLAERADLAALLRRLTIPFEQKSV